MLSKLAIRNVKRSLKDYIIYIVTVVMAFSLIFAFNFVSFSKEITELSATMEPFYPVWYLLSKHLECG